MFQPIDSYNVKWIKLRSQLNSIKKEVGRHGASRIAGWILSFILESLIFIALQFYTEIISILNEVKLIDKV